VHRVKRFAKFVSTLTPFAEERRVEIVRELVGKRRRIAEHPRRLIARLTKETTHTFAARPRARAAAMIMVNREAFTGAGRPTADGTDTALAVE